MREGKQKQLGFAIGAAIRHLRDKSGQSQEELGFEFGLHRTYISMLERGQRMPSVPTLLSLGAYLGASPVELMKLVERYSGAGTSQSKRRSTRR